jgi:hypothetical protein
VHRLPGVGAGAAQSVAHCTGPRADIASIEVDLIVETATMTPEQARQVTRTASRDELLEAVREKFDCREADVDAQGDIWIADPECGHWLSDDHLVEFVGWYYRHVR